MPRLTHKMSAALLTFILGVLAAILWLNPNLHIALPGLPRSAALADGGAPAADRPVVVECQEWAGAEVTSRGLGWDLTYLPLLSGSGLCPREPFCEVLTKKPKPPVHKHLAEWQGDPVISSILVELPDGHADMMAIWLIRTKGHAYWWGFHPHRANPHGKRPILAQDYDRAFEAMACWRQGEPERRTFGEEGYVGFLSLYREGRSRQMILTNQDLFEGSKDPDKAQPGRLSSALRPLMSSFAEQ